MSEPCYDLHCHSSQSDGILRPAELLSRAKSQGVTTLALTDHDTISGLPEATVQAELEGIDLITGVEFSCLWYGRNIHVLALNFDASHSAIQALTELQLQRRIERSEVIASKLEKLGFIGILQAAQAKADGAIIGRPHFAQAMIDTGKVKDVAHAFKQFLGAGKVGDVKLQWPDFDDVTQACSAAGGQAVLAHPLKYKMTRTKLCSMIDDFKESGGQGIEVVSGLQTPQQTGDMARLANKYELLASCGSDFHAPSGYNADLGQISALPQSVEPIWQQWSV
ncbi:PHP domain-containing protein [Agaribacterium sp. ZY112]|uniref:PHP domain-containing protein n=1 Tax=Agaribacterium sp. ZY112 TaxID=3233574 RepID=UPI0035255CE2